MPFTPATVTLQEAGPDAPYQWRMTDPLAWTGTFRGGNRRLEVPAAPDPFTTDLASVPRSLTWLLPRYGKYTKAAVLHDYLCQRFRDAPVAPDTPDAAPSLLPLRDRSDADELFRVVMAELEVPGLRRGLMWAAVSWGTLFTCLVPGRRSRPVLRWVGRGIVVAAVVACAWLLVARHDALALVGVLLGLPAAVLLGGTVALGRADRVGAALVIYPVTALFSPLLAIGLALALVLFVFLVIEDTCRGLPEARRLLRDLFSEEAKQAKVATPQFARLAAVMES
jgi:hypothetical protein